MATRNERTRPDPSQRPAPSSGHPAGATALLILFVVVVVFVIAAWSTFR